MHGRKRLPIGQTTEKGKDQTRTENLKKLLSEFLRNHRERCYTTEARRQNAQLLELNPEVYTAWNYRKLAVQHLFGLVTDEAARKTMLDEELKLVERALQANVKSYGAWHHRKWVLDFGLSSLDHEFLLLKRLLKADCRNFHGWDHRRFAVKTKGMTAEGELEYTTEKINENFSNYSAWHYRSTLLSRLIKDTESKAKLLEEEYKLVNQAYFTEPDDQSAWFYNTWLLGETKSDSGLHVVGSWPENGSSISTDAHEGSLSVTLKYDTPVNREQSFTSHALPLVISLNEMVPKIEATVRSEPEMSHLSEVQWRSVSGLQAPSRTWVTDLPIQVTSVGEYTIFVEVSSSTAGQRIPIRFNLKVTDHGTTGDHTDPITTSKVDRKSFFFWPGKESSPEELEAGMKLKLERMNIDASTAEPGLIQQDLSVVERESWQEKVLEEQIEILRELLQLEQNSKWPLLTLARVLVAHGASRFTDEILKLFKLLPDIDQDHADYYKAQYSRLYVEKITRNSDSLRKLWLDDGESLSAGWLRWNGLSLDDFGYVDRLLWVQRLDLSHNQLRTLDGLEALQLLTALNVSHNKLPSVTSLAPVRLIRNLQCLNVSHNEIGGHTVDPSRYSFPSVLMNQTHDSSLGDSRVNIEEYWEVQAIFHGMDLTVLEITGNTAAKCRKFRESIVRALPSLKLLDGEEVEQ